MNNTENTANETSLKLELGAVRRRKTMTVDARYKECYYQSTMPVLKEKRDVVENRFIFWNYMTNISMQNTIVQMSKAA